MHFNYPSFRYRGVDPLINTRYKREDRDRDLININKDKVYKIESIYTIRVKGFLKKTY
jgi:hypothetical protein